MRCLYEKFGRVRASSVTAILLTIAIFVGGCTGDQVYKPAVKLEASPESPLNTLPRKSGDALTVAVYGFADLTGQRKSSDRLALISTAVSQGADSWLVWALAEAGQGTWFRPLERAGLDNILRERQIIRSTREKFSSNGTEELPPLLFAGIIIEGGIISFDSNVTTGGAGARALGIGLSTEYREDNVSISMRLVSVNTGEIVITVIINKTIYSIKNNLSVLKFVDSGTTSIEVEAGVAVNETAGVALRRAIEEGVSQIITEGLQLGLWKALPELSGKPKETIGIHSS